MTNAKLHRAVFLREVEQLFPEIREELNQQWGLLHLEIGVFCTFVRDRIDIGDNEAVQKAFTLADKYLREGNSSMVNAITVSFLEALNLEDGRVPRAWARKLLPPTLSKRLELIDQSDER